jgi:hypothetical protein
VALTFKKDQNTLDMQTESPASLEQGKKRLFHGEDYYMVFGL